MSSKSNAPIYQWNKPRSKAGRLLGWLLLLAGSFLVLGIQPVRAQETVQQTLGARLVKTIGATPGVCAPEGSDYVDVAPGATVYICYTLINTGSVPLEPFALIDNYGDPANFDPVAWNKPVGFVLEPGATLMPTMENGLIRPVTVNANLTSLAGWGVASADGAQTRQITSNAVTINLVTLSTQASLSVSASAGTATANCSSPSVTLSSYQSLAFLCLTLTNAGSIPLTHHQIDIPGFDVSFTLTKTLDASGTVSATIHITSQDNAAMAPKLSATTMTSRAYITSTNEAGSLNVRSVTEPVVVNGPTTSVSLLKTINTTPDSCSASNSLNNITPGQQFYYCLVLISNASSLTYTEHVFAEPALKISGSFNEILVPGARISITNSYLQVNKGITPFLGPITATQSLVNSTMFYTASEPSLGYRAVASAFSSISVLTPTPTSTDVPTPVNTPIPFDTPFSTPTMTPIPPTPTATWTWTPSPTPTPSPTVLTISTPGGAATPYPTLSGMVAGAQASPSTPPLDPFAATATAQAQFGFATPVLDPFGATATAQAQFAFPTPLLDPFGATATAQAQVIAPPSPLDPFAATATFQAQFAFPSPALDPFGATATVQAQVIAPLSPLDPFDATPTFPATALDTPTQAQPLPTAPFVGSPSPLPTDTPAAAAMLPPQFITVTATFTPQPPTTPTQRPVEPPTPAPTVDARSLFVRVLDSAGAIMALIWILGGSVLFFVTAGVLAGLSFRAKEKTRFELDPDTQDAQFTVQQVAPQAGPPNNGEAHGRSDDHWPESLP